MKSNRCALIAFVAEHPSGQAPRRELVRLGMTGKAAMLAVLFAAVPAFALCTQHGTITTSSTQIVTSNDLSINGRHYMLVQNTGTTNAMNVAIGSSNAATTSDLYLGPGASWVMTMQGLKMLPSGDVAAIGNGGSTTYSFCDW
jgi:hypothetical protein